MVAQTRGASRTPPVGGRKGGGGGRGSVRPAPSCVINNRADDGSMACLTANTQKLMRLQATFQRGPDGRGTVASATRLEVRVDSAGPRKDRPSLAMR